MVWCIDKLGLLARVHVRILRNFIGYSGVAKAK